MDGRSARLALATAVALTIPLVAGEPVPALAVPALTHLQPTGTVLVNVRGNGHGHGMSQYGARGAAIAGLSYRKIVAFYYPHTTLTTLPGTPMIRVRLSNTGTRTTVYPASGLRVSGYSGTLATSGVSRYRLVASGSGVALRQLKGGTWRTLTKTPLPSGAAFSRPHGAPVRVVDSDRSSTSYYGQLRAVRSGSGVITVNRTTLDHYTAGVVPREMPASWQAQAVAAQAVAARSYGQYGVEHPQSRSYDICDTTMCQVYGGHVHYNSDGSVGYTDDPAAIRGNAGQVLRYHGATIFAQFSASDGGWTAAGGQPYLTAHADPYDNAASGDPYLDYRAKVPVAQLASYFGLKTVTGVGISSRDGSGTWGGRVTAGYVTGTTRSGKATTVQASGFDLQYALGLGSMLFRPVPTTKPAGALTSVTKASGGVTVAGWSYDADHPWHRQPITVKVDGVTKISNVKTNVSRPDLEKKYHLDFDSVAFSWTVPAGKGTHQICAYSLDTDGIYGRVLIGCKSITL